MALKIKQRKFTLWNLLVINVGTIVGIGIFFKNPGVLNTAGNAWFAIGAWIIGIVTVLLTSISFFEIASSTDGERGTLANWGRKFISEKAGRTISIFWNYVWYPVLIVTLAVFTAVFAQLAMGIGADWSSTMTTFFLVSVALVTFISVALSNYFSDEGGKWVQSISTVIKFIPLVLVAVIAFANPTVASGANAFNTNIDGVTPSVMTMIIAIPGALFALDAFLSSTNLQKEEAVKGQAAKSSVIAVSFVGAFYLLFAIGMFFGTADGSLFAIVSNTFGANGTKLVFFAITISAFGVTNGILVSWTRSLRQANEDNLFVRVPSIDKVGPTGSSKGAIKFAAIIVLAWAILLIFAGITAYGQTYGTTGVLHWTDFIDQFSNVAVIGGFFTYAVIMISAYANRFTDKVSVVKTKFFTKTAPIAIALITLISSFVIINWFFNEPVIGYFILFTVILVLVISLFNNLILDAHSHIVEKKAKVAKKGAKKEVKKVSKTIKKLDKRKK